MNKYLIVGLGNIGEEYHHTRHNIGFDVVDALAAKHNHHFEADRLAEVSQFKVKGKMFICIKPNTYMNLSGKALRYWKEKENISLENILVIVDDVALPLEKIRIRAAGSHGGHNGLKSIEATLLTDQYAKLRFGIGNDYIKGQQADYVLGKWKPAQERIVFQKTVLCTEIVESFVHRGITNTMNDYNKMTVTL